MKKLGSFRVFGASRRTGAVCVVGNWVRFVFFGLPQVRLGWNWVRFAFLAFHGSAAGEIGFVSYCRGRSGVVE